MRLIDADRLINDIDGIDKVLNPIRLDNIITIIKQAKTIDTTNRHGYWKDRDSSKFVVSKTGKCSVCGSICYSHTWDGQMPNYCPHCGARMDGDKREH